MATELLHQPGAELEYAKRHLALQALNPSELVAEVTQTGEYDHAISVIFEKPITETANWHDAYVTILALRNMQH